MYLIVESKYLFFLTNSLPVIIPKTPETTQCIHDAVLFRQTPTTCSSNMHTCYSHILVLPTPLSKPLLLSEPINSQSNHRLTKVSRNLSKDLRVVEVSHGLINRSRH